MKKIVKAWIQQIIEFDSEEEYNKYADEISKNGKKWDAPSLLIDEKTGKVTATVRKQYNNNAFPDDEKEGEK